MTFDVRPHAYDPTMQPELFDGVLARRVIAFIIDFFIIAVPVVFAAMFIFAFGIITLGLGFALYWLLSRLPWSGRSLYYGVDARRPCFGNHRHAGDGSGNAHLVRSAGLFRARRGARHLFSGFSISALTPFVLLVAFFNPRAALARHPAWYGHH